MSLSMRMMLKLLNLRKLISPPPKLPAGVMIVVVGIENDASLCVHDC